MRELEALALDLGMAVLVEVHDAAELERARPQDAAHRHQQPQPAHLRNPPRNHARTLPRVPKDRIVVTESGILSPADVARMRAAGVHTFLVGEAFMRAPDPALP